MKDINHEQAELLLLAEADGLLDDTQRAELNYHFVDYDYRSAEMAIAQHVAEAGLTWAVFRTLYLSAHYEGTFDESLAYNRIFISLSQRF